MEPYSGTDEKAEYSAYIIDRHLAQKLDPEQNPFEDLVKSFLALHADPNLLKELAQQKKQDHLTP